MGPSSFSDYVYFLLMHYPITTVLCSVGYIYCAGFFSGVVYENQSPPNLWGFISVLVCGFLWPIAVCVEVIDAIRGRS